MTEHKDFKQTLRDTFSEVLAAVNAEAAVRRSVKIESDRLEIGGNVYRLDDSTRVYAVALGKAAAAMARGLSAHLNGKLTAAVVSAPFYDDKLPMVWQQFQGGHPTPNQSSLQAARAAFELLASANSQNSPVIFLISGGGSAMLELPTDDSISLADLQTAYRLLVGCGATIAEINQIRRRLSKVKNGGLSRAASLAKQVALIISDTNHDQVFNVASGPTITCENDSANSQIIEIIEHYGLANKLPTAILSSLQKSPSANSQPKIKNCLSQVLLANETAIEAAAQSLREKKIAVETANDLIENPIDAGCRELTRRLCDLRLKTDSAKPVAIVSGGEFVCPVLGRGTGGRNLESALRTAILFDQIKNQTRFANAKFAALFAGTDGIDGNSGAAGASCDDSTIKRAAASGLNAKDYLQQSDSDTFFRALGDRIETGATGTNVRDIRILTAL